MFLIAILSFSIFLSLGLFTGLLTPSEDCQLLSSLPLDRERSSEYRVSLSVDTLSAFVNPLRSTASVRVRVGDANDESPSFVYPTEQEREQGRMVVAVQDAAPEGAVMFRLKVNMLSLSLKVFPITIKFAGSFFDNGDKNISLVNTNLWWFSFT